MDNEALWRCADEGTYCGFGFVRLNHTEHHKPRQRRAHQPNHNPLIPRQAQYGINPVHESPCSRVGGNILLAGYGDF